MAKHDTHVPGSDFSDLKMQAIELLEWKMQDMSPKDGPQLHLKCGIEREANMIPSTFPLPGDDPINTWGWSCDFGSLMTKITHHLQDTVKDPGLERIYYDSGGGAFVIEGVTKTLDLYSAVKAINSISAKMIASTKSMNLKLPPGYLAPTLSISHAAFGGVAADTILQAQITKPSTSVTPRRPVYDVFMGAEDEEIYDLSGLGHTLIGRGHHCNLSIWCGDKNLFSQRKPDVKPHNLLNHAVQYAVDHQPHMMLPCRNGNYARIAADVAGAVRFFGLNGLTEGKFEGMSIRFTDATSGDRSLPEKSRLEFRHSAAEAPPEDVALSSALPLVKACDEVIEKDDKGHCKLDKDGKPLLKSVCTLPDTYTRPVPKNADEAGALFNTADNPYFVYLDTLAAEKIKCAEDQCKRVPGAASNLALQEAVELRGIGTTLHGEYCRQYGLESAMPPLPISHPGRR